MDDVATRLREAPCEIVGRFADASNATLLVRLTDRDPAPLPAAAAIEDLDPDDLAVYKPRRGEAPLWDFPEGTLHRREVAAYVVSERLGWDLVPTTVLRPDAPLGVGSLQRYVAHDPQRHYFAIVAEGRERLLAQLRAMVVFDLLIDNADRKGGHVLVEQSASGERIRLVDHGVSFNAEWKLRTVAWDFQDEPIPAALRDDVIALRDAFADMARLLADLLHDDEIAALGDRLDQVGRLERFPAPAGPRPYPWPLL